MNWPAEIFYGLVTVTAFIFSLRRGGWQAVAGLLMAAAWCLQLGVYLTRPAFAGNFSSILINATLVLLFCSSRSVLRSTWGVVVISVLLIQVWIHIMFRCGHLSEAPYHLSVNLLYVVRMAAVAWPARQTEKALS